MKTKKQLPEITIDVLQKWADHCRAAKNKFDEIDKIFGNHAESPLGEAVFKMFDAYTDTLAKLVGDGGGWLSWYMWENNCGEAGLSASGAADKPMRPIRTVRDLVRLLADSDECESKRTGRRQRPTDHYIARYR